MIGKKFELSKFYVKIKLQKSKLFEIVKIMRFFTAFVHCKF